MRRRFEPEKMMEEDIYPKIWDFDPEEDDVLGYLIEYYNVLKSFVQDAAEKKRGLIVYVC